MAPLSKTLALAAAFAALSSAAPVNKRDLVWETVTDVVWTTVDTTITLYPGEPTPTAAAVSTTSAVVAVTPTSAAAPAPAPQESSSSSSSSSSSTSSSSSSTEIIPIVTPAPEPTTSAAPEPTTTPAPAPAPEPSSTTSSAPAPSSSSSSSSGSGSGSSSSGQCSESSPCAGDGTYYNTADTMTNPSFCDTANDGYAENVVALSSAIMNEGYCGKTITVSYNGKTSTAKVVDKCPSCSASSIDMSPALFGDLADLALGRIHVEWWFNN
ncbi:hypothetical protein VTN96DRAFT_7169 [Rasamsonia emersonii]